MFDNEWFELKNYRWGVFQYWAHTNGKVIIRLNTNTWHVYQMSIYKWKKNCLQYKRVKLAGKTYEIHRVLWEEYNEKKIPHGWQVDHIDHNKYNNAIINLRCITASENVTRSNRRRKGVTRGNIRGNR